MTFHAVVHDKDDMSEAVRRTRIRLVHPRSGTAVVDEHLRVGLPAPARWAVLADVLHTESEGPARAAELAAGHPGALVVAVHHGPLCWIRFTCQGLPRTLTIHRPEAASDGQVWKILASLAHAWLGAGLPVELLGPALSTAVVRNQQRNQ
jgi:hypothetical protein